MKVGHEPRIEPCCTMLVIAPLSAMWASNGCLIIAQTGQQGPVLFKGDKGINDAAHPSEGGPAEAGGLSASSLPLGIDRPARMLDINEIATKHLNFCILIRSEIYGENF